MSKDITPEELEQVVSAALGELLNLAAGVAELQTTDEGADSIYAICDLVAEYYQIERVQAIIEDHDDGSFTTRFEHFTGEGDVYHTIPQPTTGHIRTTGRPKLRLVDKDDNNSLDSDTHPDD
jgi:hypothetical protein|tara:strand:- start:279 stop:644 length:366 start_codon:yes stop_codon:yes gene_type:complete